MPEPLGPSSAVAHLQDQADSMSITSSREHSDAESLQSSWSRAARLGAASSGGAAISLRTKRGAYRPFKQEGCVDLSSFVVNIQNNPFAADTEGTAAFEWSRPPSPATGTGTASNW